MMSSLSSEKKKEIMEFMLSRVEGLGPEFEGHEISGFVLEDLVEELDVTYEEVIEAAESLLLWVGVQIAMTMTQDALENGKVPADVVIPEGYVYVFKNGVHFKIGSSINPKQRLAAINRGIPPGHSRVLPWLEFKVTNYRDAEKELHTVFEDKKVVSETGGVEWFALTIADLEWISHFMEKWDGECRFGLDISLN
jgi:hypothetical protein